MAAYYAGDTACSTGVRTCGCSTHDACPCGGSDRTRRRRTPRGCYELRRPDPCGRRHERAASPFTRIRASTTSPRVLGRTQVVGDPPLVCIAPTDCHDMAVLRPTGQPDSSLRRTSARLPRGLCVDRARGPTPSSDSTPLHRRRSHRAGCSVWEWRPEDTTPRPNEDVGDRSASRTSRARHRPTTACSSTPDPEDVADRESSSSALTWTFRASAST